MLLRHLRLLMNIGETEFFVAVIQIPEVKKASMNFVELLVEAMWCNIRRKAKCLTLGHFYLDEVNIGNFYVCRFCVNLIL